MKNSFNTRDTFELDDQVYHYHRLDALTDRYDIDTLPYAIRLLLENLLRNEDGYHVTSEQVHAICQWQDDAFRGSQIAFTPARVVLQDFTGVPAIVDLAAMRDAISALGGDPDRINPQVPVDLVVDHSVMVDHFASPQALKQNTQLEFERNRERYQFLRWGQHAFSNFRVVPPGTGIVHQVNLEYLGKVVMTGERDDCLFAYPDTLVGTDSHTPMINGLGVLGWGVGGIEAEAAMLGQPISMRIPEVIGFQLEGELPEGATATDLVLAITKQLREKGVVGKFIEFYGDGLDSLPVADRATIANMAPEYGATCSLFPIDKETLRYLALTGRDDATLTLIETYAKKQQFWRETGASAPRYSDTAKLDLATVEPGIAGPKRPQDFIPLKQAKVRFDQYLQTQVRNSQDDAVQLESVDFASEGGQSAMAEDNPYHSGAVEFELNGETQVLKHGDVVIAAITSCTNTSNPAVMIAAGLVAKRANEKGLKVKPWVKTSFAPGSQVVPAYLESAGLSDALDALGFNLVGFGCTTCIGNSGPLPKPIKEAIHEGDLCVSAVLSGNRNFEGRIHPDVRANYLASPPLVVAYALAGSMNKDLYTDPLGNDASGQPVYLKDIWPSQNEIAELVQRVMSAELFAEKYASVFEGTQAWHELDTPKGARFDWPASSYVKDPPFFHGIKPDAEPPTVIENARCLVKLGDSITTDHISPAGAIAVDSAAGQYLQAQGVLPKEFNSYGSRRGNHEVMMRGTFANVRLRNQLAPDTEGGWTRYFPDDEAMSIYDAAMRYQKEKVPLVVLAGKEYGTGSSRDWAAKGTRLLGVVAVIAESYERIHRSNLIGFGVAPLKFREGDSADSLGLTGKELFTIGALDERPNTVDVTAHSEEGDPTHFSVEVNIDTDSEWEYFEHGGILHYVLRQLARNA